MDLITLQWIPAAWDYPVHWGLTGDQQVLSDALKYSCYASKSLAWFQNADNLLLQVHSLGC